MKISEFSRLVTAFSAQLRHLATPYAQTYCSPDDLVQETFLRLWKHREQLRGAQDFEAMAVVTLRNVGRDLWRRQQLSREAPPEGLVVEAERQIEATNEVELIRQIVAQLPPLQQEVFRMKAFEGYEKEEIARITGATDEAIRQLLSRARRRIRDEYCRITQQRLSRQ